MDQPSRRTYSIESSAPRPLEWRDYEAEIIRLWEELLSSDTAQESDIQDFLEKHPCMVPGSHGVIGTSGHPPSPPALLSQPPLPHFTRDVPDFMWIAKDSLYLCPVLVEIENPKKRWFTKNGDPTAHLTHALRQLADWKAWFSDSHNQAAFTRYYNVECSYLTFKPEYVLIYGRRAEFEDGKSLIRRRAAMQASDQVLMTFDRVAPDSAADNYMTVNIDKEGYRAKYIPPTFELGPRLATARLTIRGKQAAVRRSPHFSAERRAFLERRMPYWDAWARQRHADGGHRYSIGDRE